jgi:hypothetical protein
MTDSDSAKRARLAADQMREARHGWGSSQGRAGEYLAAKENQLEVLKDIRSTEGEGALGGGISSAIEGIEHDISNIESEIRKLRPGY